MADIEALRSKVKTLLELALAELDGDSFSLVIHLEEAVKSAEELEDAIMGPEEDAAEDALVEPEDVAALIRETFEGLEGLEGVDIESLSTWTITGISLFRHDRLPKLSVLVDEARRVLVTRAHQIFSDNITHVAQAMRTSRRTARTLLKRYGLKEPRSRCPLRIAPDPIAGSLPSNCGTRARHSRFPSLRLLGQHEQDQDQ